MLDGVPYTVIDGMDALPYPTTAGTSYVRPRLCCYNLAQSRTAVALQETLLRVCCGDCMSYFPSCVG